VSQQSTPPPFEVVRSTDSKGLDYATLDLLAKWKKEDATDDPDEIRAAERELAEFMQAINENRSRSGEPPVFP
jgi:hypothetical protein